MKWAELSPTSRFNDHRRCMISPTALPLRPSVAETTLAEGSVGAPRSGVFHLGGQVFYVEAEGGSFGYAALRSLACLSLCSSRAAWAGRMRYPA